MQINHHHLKTTAVPLQSIPNTRSQPEADQKPTTPNATFRVAIEKISENSGKSIAFKPSPAYLCPVPKKDLLAEYKRKARYKIRPRQLPNSTPTASAILKVFKEKNFSLSFCYNVLYHLFSI